MLIEDACGDSSELPLMQRFIYDYFVQEVDVYLRETEEETNEELY